ncbi:heavy metal-responsive transcriptional regulator [Streptomyces sp. A3M-1-3]|uniref:heavy metal-responsive transcriptional regulator n=1 Tax=Streptomyces sp. A3M-1-3 TaxID=2962044 RepID=UPI0020B79CD3|nr:heavy metal-responsive transcriptional regulator [Streptomyces sp. A3M-1-3]MCP3818822.1 heavy metal-responsive transcriptional regulator [Streptomyces sp. A3M-1-3]
MTVGKAADLVGVSAKAIRLWEARGLIPRASRTESGYRLFDEADLEVLRFIRRAKTLGLTLEEINDILDLQRGGAQPCGRVTEMLDAHLLRIDRRLAELQQLRQVLLGARRAADRTRRTGGEAVVCQAIESQPDPDQWPPGPPRHGQEG